MLASADSPDAWDHIRWVGGGGVVVQYKFFSVCNIICWHFKREHRKEPMIITRPRVPRINDDWWWSVVSSQYTITAVKWVTVFCIFMPHHVLETWLTVEQPNKHQCEMTVCGHLYPVSREEASWHHKRIMGNGCVRFDEEGYEEIQSRSQPHGPLSTIAVTWDSVMMERGFRFPVVLGNECSRKPLAKGVLIGSLIIDPSFENPISLGSK